MVQLLLNESAPHPSLLHCFDRPYLDHVIGGSAFVYARAVVDILLVVSIIVVNIILIVATSFYRRSNRGTVRVYNSGTSMKFVQMLAVSDVFVALTVPVYLIPHYLCDVNDLVRGNEYLCMTKFVATVFSGVMTNMSLLSIAIDRYMAVHYTLKYRVIMTHRVCHCMIAAQIVFAVLSSVVLFFWNHWTQDSYCDLEDVVPMVYAVAMGATVHSLILMTVVGVHFKMHQRATECASRRSIIELRVSKETTNSIKSAKVVVLVTGLYFICWTPFTICLMTRILSTRAHPLIDFFFQLTYPLTVGSSLLNPFVYAWKNSEIQSAVVWSIRRVSRVCHCMLAAQIVFAVLSSAVLFFWNHWTQDSYCDLEDVVPMVYVVAMSAIVHGLILMTVAGVHFKMHQKATECASRRSIIELRVSKETRNSIKSAKVVVLVTGLYFICWTPYSICLMTRMLSSRSNAVIDFFFQLTFPLSVANSLLNPFIYAWKNSEIQSAVVWSIRRASR